MQYATIDDARGEERLDSRDLIELREYMRDALEIEDDALDPDERDEFAAAIAAIDELENETGGEWPYGAFFILESAFEDYARELAEEIGAIKGDEHWPFSCIDWEHAASELAMDYSSVTFLGCDYYVRTT